MDAQLSTYESSGGLNARQISIAAVVFAVVGIAAFIGSSHETGTPYGLLSLLPTAFVLAFALTTHRTVEALFAGCMVGLLMLSPTEFIPGLVSLSMEVMQNETIAWIILVCGLMGGLIAVLEKGGSILSVSAALVKKVKSQRQSMLLTFVLGIVVFMDDYLNAIAISSTMKRITDTYKISREKLAYLVDSTAAPVCILIPISTWGIFFASLLEANDVAESGNGLSVYIESIPYMAYGWVTLLVVFLVATKALPDLGPMKAAELRAQSGQTQPDGAVDIDLGGDVKAHSNPTMGILNFVLPMVVLVAVSWMFGIDLLAGVFAALIFTLTFYGLQNLVPMNSLFDAVFDGIKIMLVPLATVVGGFMLKSVNDQLGLTQYMIDTVAPLLSPALFPAAIFLLMAMLVFATASSWGLFAVAMPIVFPIAEAIGAPLPLVIGALVSASAAGSHSCFFSDSTVLSAQGSGCTAMQHARTQIPYALIGIVTATVFFLIAASW